MDHGSWIMDRFFIRSQSSLIFILSYLSFSSAIFSIVLHSFSGKPSFIPSLLALSAPIGNRLFFSFSSCINLRGDSGQKHVTGCLSRIPENRLLIESDVEDPQSVPSGLQQIGEFIASKKKWTEEETKRRLAENMDSANVTHYSWVCWFILLYILFLFS